MRPGADGDEPVKPLRIPIDKDREPERWLQLRRSFIGSSDGPAVCGYSPYSGPLTVFLNKTGQTPDKEATEIMSWGNILEDPIAREWGRRTGKKVERCNAILLHPEYQFIGCDIDRWTEEDGKRAVLEVKNVSRWNEDEWGEDFAPDHFNIQVQHQMFVCDTDFAWIVALIGGNKLHTVRVERNDTLIEAMLSIYKDFWQHVIDRTPPPIDDSKEAEAVLRYCSPSSVEGEFVNLDDDQTTILKKLLQAREAERLIKEEIQGYRNRLIQAMGNAEAAYIPGQEKPVLTYKGSVTRRLNVERITRELPEVCAKYYTESTTRRFLVKGSDE